MVINSDVGNVGRTPYSKEIPEQIQKAYNYAVNWYHQGQIFSYSGSGPDESNYDPNTFSYNPDWTFDGDNTPTFYVHLISPPKADTVNPTRRLMALMLPWRAQITATMDWDDGSGASEVWNTGGIQFDGSATTRKTVLSSSRIQTITDSDFTFTPAASGVVVGELSYEYMMIAALAIRVLPDAYLTERQQVLGYSNFRPGSPIYGLNTTGDRSISEITQRMGNGGRYDGAEYVTRRCLFSWGHPLGIESTTTSYRTINDSGEDTCIVFPRWFQQTDLTATVIVTWKVVGSGTAYFRATSNNGADSVSTSTTSTTTTTSTLTGLELTPSDAFGHEGIKLEMQAPSGSSVVVHTVSIWEESRW